MPTTKYLPNFPKNRFEKACWSQNQVVCGLDEVGRGCLAGPLVVAAVIIPVNKSHTLLKDSKELSQEELQTARRWISKNCIYSVVPVHHRFIDAHNIYQATLTAMKRAVMQICSIAPQAPSQIVVDAMPLMLAGTPYESLPVAHFIKGETKSISIAAASIVAKVYRDELISRYGMYIPGYQLEEHKGYSTAKHIEALDALGKSFIHRTTYLKRVPHNEYRDTENQQTIC